MTTIALPDRLLLLCRPGFEKECAGEILQLAAGQSFAGYIRTTDGSAVVQLISSSAPNNNPDSSELLQGIDFRQLIFTRQWCATGGAMTLPQDNRLDALLQGIQDYNLDFSALELAYADTNAGKALSRFCRQFRPHLEKAMQSRELLRSDSPWRLLLFFHDSCHVHIGLCPVDNSAGQPMGIPRLKMPAGAPSRSTLKLEEAIHHFLGRQEAQLLHNGMHAVDLGAAPGGWSWQLVQRGLLVTAIDNGTMQDKLMQGGMVEHLRRDAFTYAPKKPVDWLVCDMAERPLHVSRLIARWFTQGLCRHAIFNLKLPMKKRLASVHECLDLLHRNLQAAGLSYRLQAKQLYHDREEITVCIVTEGKS